MAIDWLRMKRFEPKNPFDVNPSPEFQQAVNIPTPNLDAPDPVQQQQPIDYSNESLKRFLAMAVPERTEPNLISKIGGIMMSATRSPEDVDKAVNSRYYGKVADYQNTVNNMLKGAAVEGQQNQYKSLENYRQGQLGVANRKAATGEFNALTGRGRAEANARTNDERIKIANAKLVLDQERSKYRGAVLKGVPGGNFQWFFPDGRRVDSTVSSGQMSDRARMDLEQDYAMARQDDQQAATASNIQASGEVQKSVKASPSYSDTHAGPPTEFAVAQERRNRAGYLLRSRPDWGDYLKIDGPNVIITPETPPDLRDIINNYIDKQSNPNFVPGGEGLRRPEGQTAPAPVQQQVQEEKFNPVVVNPAQQGLPDRALPNPTAPQAPQAPQKVPAVRAVPPSPSGRVMPVPPPTGPATAPGMSNRPTSGVVPTPPPPQSKPMTGQGNAVNQTPIGGGDPNEKVVVVNVKSGERATVSRRNLPGAMKDGWRQE